ncbi:MAG: EF-P lysine aminoacylase EpmA [Thermoguttaceae bacterium]|jgi:lysyl-tRNA synthetase class 2
MTTPSLPFRPTASVAVLKERALLLNRLRRFFDERGFFEVQTPVLSRDVLLDRYIEPLSVAIGRETFYLQTSPEFALKRILASGSGPIYEITPAFRQGDRGPLHNVEFTLLEWYRSGDGYAEGIALLGELADTFLPSAGAKTVCRSFGALFLAATGINPHGATAEELRRVADRLAPGYPESYVTGDPPAAPDDWIDYLFEEKVQPSLGAESPIILCDYPVSQSQLAEIGAPLDPDGGASSVTHRFELFAKGIELANGYNELTDPTVLRARFAETARLRTRRGAPKLPVESRLLAAMDVGLPHASGCALGVDRLLMVRLGLATIDEVIPFPTEIA